MGQVSQVRYAPLARLEIDTDQALKRSKSNFDVYMSLSEEVLGMGCLNWWINITERASRPIILGKPDIVIASDSSLT